MSGYVSYRAGLSAEDGVAADYQRRGHRVAATRWRCAAGEIDLIVREGDTIVFVEVKRARDFETAAGRLGPHQFARIGRAAAQFLAGEPRGQDTDARFDVALVDGTGAVRVIENVLMA
jgi:putative endonuclease